MIFSTLVHADLTVSNGLVSVSLNEKNGTFSASCGRTRFLDEGHLSNMRGTPVMTRIISPFGTADAIEYRYADGSADQIALVPDQPFIAIRSLLFNSTRDTVVIEKRTPVRFSTSPGLPLKQVRILGCDGLTPADTVRASYSFMQVVEPETRRGVLTAWLSYDRGSGIVTAEPSLNSVLIRGTTEYGKLRIAPEKRAEGEILLVGYFDDAFRGLEAYADAIAQYYRIKLRPIPKGGHCTWPALINGQAGTEEGTAKLADYCETELLKYGFEILQMDDFWQNGPDRQQSRNRGPRGDFTTHRPDGPYPNGMQRAADYLKSRRIVPGIWFLPFAWDKDADVMKNHRDWFVHRADGSVFETRWAGDCLDMTHPDAVRFLKQSVSRMTKQWGFQYLKIDGLYAGMAVENIYGQSPRIVPDSLGQAIFHDSEKTAVEAYRDGLKAVRDAAGPDVYILGCNGAQNYRSLGASFGLLDGMRTGHDVNPTWRYFLRGVDAATRLYFLHNRVWHNDPDHLMLREPLTLDQARSWGTWITLTGQLNLCGEYHPALPPERLEIVKRSMPNTGLCGRPVDLFDRPQPRIWQMTDLRRQGNRRDVVGLFNWDDEVQQDVAVDLSRLEIPIQGQNSFAGFDYWENQFVGPFSGKMAFTLKPSACKSISIRPVSEFPQVIGTSRHITQGLCDLKEEAWDRKNGLLSGTSSVVEDDPYEIRVVVPPSGKWKRLISASVSDEDVQAQVTVQIKPDGKNYRIALLSSENREVKWKLFFK